MTEHFAMIGNYQYFVEEKLLHILMTKKFPSKKPGENERESNFLIAERNKLLKMISGEDKLERIQRLPGSTASVMKDNVTSGGGPVSKMSSSRRG